MTSENTQKESKKSLCNIKKSVCNAIRKTKDSYFECDFDIGEKIHGGNPESPEICTFKNGTIRLRIFDLIVVSAAMGMIISLCKLFKK